MAFPASDTELCRATKTVPSASKAIADGNPTVDTTVQANQAFVLLAGDGTRDGMFVPDLMSTKG